MNQLDLFADREPPPRKETLEEAKERLQAGLQKGMRCPCCGQFAKIYKRRINSGMARSLITMYRRGGLDWMHIPTRISARSREEGKLAYWGLVEESTDQREDGGRAGYWRVTQKGKDFLHQAIRLPKYALVYNAHLIRLDDAMMVDIKDCLGAKFDLAELMGWRT